MKIAENFHDPRTTKQGSPEDPAVSALMDPAGAPMGQDSGESVAYLGQPADENSAHFLPFIHESPHSLLGSTQKLEGPAAMTLCVRWSNTT
jgi:hypothetical protein